jgi:hypothetical protein
MPMTDDDDENWDNWSFEEHIQQFHNDAEAMELALSAMRDAGSGFYRASAADDLGRYIDDVRVRSDYLMRRLADEGLIDPVYAT